MSVLFDSCFLHDGHIGGRSSSRSVLGLGSADWSPAAVAGVDSTDLGGMFAELVSNVHFTGMRFFRLRVCKDEYDLRSRSRSRYS